MTLEKALDSAAAGLPDGWKIRIEVEHGWGGVTVIRPDQSEVDMDDADMDLCEQVRAAHDLALIEQPNTKVRNAGQDDPAPANNPTPAFSPPTCSASDNAGEL